MCSASKPATVFSSSIIAILATTQSTSGEVRYVDQNATGPAHNGTSWCSAFTELQDAISVALPGDDIFIAGGTYTPDRGAGQVAGDRTATFSLANSVVWQGGYAGCGAPDPNARDVVANETVLDGDLLGDDGLGFVNYADNSFHVVTYADSSATGSVLDGLTVRGGNADGKGGAGVTNQGGAIHIRNGIEKCIAGGPTIRNCVIRDNRQLHHGAVNDHGHSTVIESCTFIGNHSDLESGALQIHNGSPMVTDTVFLNNTSGGRGGAVWSGQDVDPTCNLSGSPTFRNCTFNGNSADIDGGAMYITGSNPTLGDCLFESNTAREHGGAIYSAEQSVLLVQDTRLSGNAVTDANSVFFGGGAIYSAFESSAMIERCFFEFNNAPLASAIYTYSQSDLTVVDSEFTRNLNSFAVACYANSDCEISNSLFYDNDTLGVEVLWNLLGSTSVLRNCTMVTGAGGAIFMNTVNSQVSILNSVLTCGAASSCLQAPAGDWVIRHSCVTQLSALPVSFEGEGNVEPALPLLFANVLGLDGVPWSGDEDLRLNPSAPCVDAGQNLDVTTTTDLDGNPRIVNSIVDMGAFEVQSGQHLCGDGACVEPENSCNCPAECGPCDDSAVCNGIEFCDVAECMPGTHAQNGTPCGSGNTCIDGICQPSSIPTISQWGAAIMVLVLLALGTLLTRRPVNNPSLGVRPQDMLP